MTKFLIKTADGYFNDPFVQMEQNDIKHAFMFDSISDAWRIAKALKRMGKEEIRIYRENDLSNDIFHLLSLAMQFTNYAVEDRVLNNDWIQVVIIDPFKPPYKKVIRNTVEEKQVLVGGLIEYFEIGKFENGEKIIIITNEERHFLDLPFNRRLIGVKDTSNFLLGTVIISKMDKDNRYVSLTDQQCKKIIKQFKPFEVYI